jgi:hypothetical protein
VRFTFRMEAEVLPCEAIALYQSRIPVTGL